MTRRKLSVVILSLAIVFTATKTTTAFSDEEADYFETWNAEHIVYPGFPVGIICKIAFPFWYAPYPDISKYTRCVIYKDGIVIYNKTTDENTSILDLGVFDKTDDSWDGVAVNVTALTASGNATRFKETYVTVGERRNFDCVNASNSDYKRRRSVTVGEQVVLPCDNYILPDFYYGNHIPVVIHLTEDMKPNYTAWWYKGCERISRDDPDYEYVEEPYKLHETDGAKYASLRVRNASVTSTPGIYSCVLEANDGDYSTAKTYHFNSKKVCVKRKYNPFENVPSVQMLQNEYTVKPGEDLKVQATGILGADRTSISLVWEWTRMSDGEKVCDSYNKDTPPKCSHEMHENKRYCLALQEHEVHKVYKDYIGNNFTATFWIRNANKTDEGEYMLRYSRYNDHVEDNFTVHVVDIASESHRWTVAVIVAGVLIVVAVFLLVLLHKNRTDVRYISKKLFGKYKRTNKPMAFLIYSRDVAKDLPGALDKVTQFFGGRRFYDPNNLSGTIENNQAGQLVHDNIVQTMEQSQSVIIFVTESLLTNNDTENFAVYQGLEDNVRQALPLIFICNKSLRKRIRDSDFDDVNAVRSFMSHQKSRVIIWDENRVSSFRRALYVALPKVPHIGVNEEIV